MKRCLTLLLLVLALLPACGPAAPELTSATTSQTPATTEMETTTEPEPTTEAPTTTRASIIGEGISWRIVSRDATMKTRIWWDEEIPEYNKKTELKLSDDKTVVVKREYAPARVTNRVLLRNEADGSEILLLEHTEPSDYEGSHPYLSCALDERYFVLTWLSMGHWAGSVFDIQEKREIPIKFPEGFNSAYFLTYASDGYLYFKHSGEYVPLQIARIELNALLKGNSLASIALSWTEAAADYTNMDLISPGGRYLAAVDEQDTLLVFDLKQRKRVFDMPPPEGYRHLAPHFADDHTLYFYEWDNDSPTHILEITLP